VARFLRDVLKRNNIDDMGGRIVSTVNCVVKQAEQPPAGSRVWLNAFWDGAQMLYGQDLVNGKLRSLASSLSVVAHELFHGVTGSTARLLYLGESGALNESYSDIFGTIISNRAEPNIAKWDWLIGDGISSGIEALRDMRDPTRFDQPKLMKDFKILPLKRKSDAGGVHINSGIHNFAAFNVMSATNGRAFVFKPAASTNFAASGIDECTNPAAWPRTRILRGFSGFAGAVSGSAASMRSSGRLR